LLRSGIIQSQVHIYEGTNLPGKIVQGILAVGMLIANSPAYNWKAVLMISKGILTEAMPPGGAPGLYRRRVRYSEIVHSGCAESIIGQIQD
jgi:hypothetical protein